MKLLTPDALKDLTTQLGQGTVKTIDGLTNMTDKEKEFACAIMGIVIAAIHVSLEKLEVPAPIDMRYRN